MITLNTYLFSNGKKYGWLGYGSAECPYCGIEGDIGTGEHSNPDITLCGCGKWFRYWPSGCTQRVNAKRQAELNQEICIYVS